MKCEGDYNGCYVTDISAGDYIKVRGVDFGETGATTFTAMVRAEKSCTIMLRTGSKSGSLMGKLSVVPTNGEWQEFTCELTSPVKGVCDLFFTFKANSSSNLDFDSWQFGKEPAAIREVTDKAKGEKSDAVYDLNGRYVYGQPKGISIVGGKKIIRR